MSNAETLNQYIKELFDYRDGKNDEAYRIKMTEVKRVLDFNDEKLFIFI